MTWLCENGHIARTHEIREIGVTRRQLADAVRNGTLTHARRGIYVCTHLDAHQLRAAETGGLIDCVSALRRHEDLWCGPPDERLHLRFPAHHQRYGVTQEVSHWRKPVGGPIHGLEVAPIDALLQAMACLAPYDALAAIESAVHLAYLPQDQLSTLIALAPERLQPVLARMNLLSQSGFETHTRLKVEDAGHSVECQVSIPGAGILDLLVAGRVGIETDGRKWHENRFEADRSKDIRVAAWGIPVLRLGRSHIFDSWPETLAGLERLLAEARRTRSDQRRFRPYGGDSWHS